MPTAAAAATPAPTASPTVTLHIVGDAASCETAGYTTPDGDACEELAASFASLAHDIDDDTYNFILAVTSSDPTASADSADSSYPSTCYFFYDESSPSWTGFWCGDAVLSVPQ